MRVKLIIVVVLLVVAGAITWAVLAMNDWEDRCVNAGGHVESEFVGFTMIPIVNDKGIVTGWNQVPNYNYYCRNAVGQDIEVPS